jgi:hypothetical protein
VRTAYVVAIGATTGALRVTSTDRDGRFSFTNLPADRYTIGVSKPPYLGTVAGAKRPARPGTPIALSDGQKIADVTIRMPLGAAITGVITDERGQPATNTQVNLLQRRLQGVERVLTTAPGGTVLTDDRGRYRVFGLPPGEYVVSASRFGIAAPNALSDADVDAALKGGRVAPPAPVDQSSGYTPVFYPGTTREGDAQPITLGVGEERENIDFHLELAKRATVEGVVISSDSPVMANVNLIQKAAAGSSTQMLNVRGGIGVRAMPDGRFSFDNIGPGSYLLIARSIAAGLGPGAQPPPAQFAMASVEVAGVTQSGIQLTMGPALTLSARIAFDGASPAPAMNGRRVPITSLTPGMTGTAAPQVTPTTATGAFTVTGVLPGRYVLGGPLFFGATSDSVTWALQSVVVDGRDVTDLPLDITPDAIPKDIVVTFGDRAQSLSGKLQQSSGAPATDYTIIVFPADKAYWLPQSRRILTTRPGTDGTFTLGGPGPTTLPPGAYLLAAVTEIDRDEQFDPALLQSIVASAVPVTIQAGEKKIQDLIIR